MWLLLLLLLLLSNACRDSTSFDSRAPNKNPHISIFDLHSLNGALWSTSAFFLLESFFVSSKNDIFDSDFVSIFLLFICDRFIYRISRLSLISQWETGFVEYHHVIESNGGEKRWRKRTQRVCKQHELNNVPLCVCVCVSRSLPHKVF